MWSHVILVLQTTLLLIESRLLLYLISRNINTIYVFNVVSSIFPRCMTDYAIMCVRMYECIPVCMCIMHFVVSYFITE